jgi:peptide/nickel transport system permease protein
VSSLQELAMDAAPVAAFGASSVPVGDAEPDRADLPRRRRLRRLNGKLIGGGTLLVAIVLATVFVPVFSPYGPDQINATASLQGPTWAHLLGTDDLGRDLLSRLAQGYEISLLVALGSVAFAFVIGIPLGLFTGVSESILEQVVMRVLDVLMGFPALLLAIVMVAILGTGTVVVVLAIGIVYVPIVVRVMRATASSVSRELYVEVARSRGASYRRVVLRHVLPNSFGPVVVQGSILMGVAVLLEAALSFIGLGVQPPTASLGLMLNEGRNFMSTSPWIAAVPGFGIVLLVLSFTLIGDGLQQVFDPHEMARSR